MRASGGEVHPPAWPFDFNESNKMYDAAALRRGWHVYKNVSFELDDVLFLYDSRFVKRATQWSTSTSAK